MSSEKTDLDAIRRKHRRRIRKLGILDKPWLILGSAPDPSVPVAMKQSHARIDINNAGRTATELGLGRAALTIRAKKKSWEEHSRIDTDAMIWIHTIPEIFLRFLLIGKPYKHIGRVYTLTRRDREAIVTEVSGASVAEIGDLGKVTNGVAAACYGLFLGVPHVVLAGISLSKVGHSYDTLGRARRQVAEDTFILERFRNDPRVQTTEPDLARDTGIMLIS